MGALPALLEDAGRGARAGGRRAPHRLGIRGGGRLGDAAPPLDGRAGDRLAARDVARLAGSAVLIALNWLLYVWAVAHDHVVEASLGYFINPLVNVLLGVLVLRERLSRAQWLAVALAAAGVAVLTAGHGRLPWIALALAVTFGLYGLARKTVGADAVVGLLWETGLLAPLAAAWLLSLEARGSGAFGAAHPGASALLVLGGAVTAVPLVLFAQGARSLPLSTLGLLQYLSPSIQFLLAVLVFRERLHRPRTRRRSRASGPRSGS